MRPLPRVPTTSIRGSAARTSVTIFAHDDRVVDHKDLDPRQSARTALSVGGTSSEPHESQLVDDHVPERLHDVFVGTGLRACCI